MVIQNEPEEFEAVSHKSSSEGDESSEIEDIGKSSPKPTGNESLFNPLRLQALAAQLNQINSPTYSRYKT